MRSSKTVKPGFFLCSLPFTRKTWARREPVPACHSWSELGLVNDILCLSLETPAGRTRFKPTLGRPCRERKFGLILAEGIFILNLCHFVPFSGLFQSYGMWLYTPGIPWGPWDNHSCFLKLQMASFCLGINKSCLSTLFLPSCFPDLSFLQKAGIFLYQMAGWLCNSNCSGIPHLHEHKFNDSWIKF